LMIVDCANPIPIGTLTHASSLESFLVKLP
jgi:hypothetical protein